MESKSDGLRSTGFAGLDSMLSDVDATIATVPEAKPPEPKKSEPVFVVREREEGSVSSTPAPSGGFSSAGKWFLGAVVAVIVIAVASTDGKRKDVPVPYEPPQARSVTSEPARSVAPDPAPSAAAVEPLSASVNAALHAATADKATPEPKFASPKEKAAWLGSMSRRLEANIPDQSARLDFLKTAYYEARRAGLDPQMVLALVDKVSGFRKYEVSSNGAQGYMQIAPTWVTLIGSKETNLFHLRTNLRYGCTILRHYLDIENGDIFRALIRYQYDMNGNDFVEVAPGDADFPNSIRVLWQNKWSWKPS